MILYFFFFPPPTSPTFFFSYPQSTCNADGLGLHLLGSPLLYLPLFSFGRYDLFFYFFYFLIIRVWGLWRLTLDGDPFCTAECLIFFEFYFVGVGHYLSFVFWVWRVSGPRNQLKGWLVDWIGASHDCSRLWLYTRVGSHPTWFALCFGFKVRVFGTWICGFIFHFPF